MELLATVFDGPLPYFILGGFVLLHDPSNRRAVLLLRAWKNPRRK